MNLPPNFPALLTAAAAWIDSLERLALAHGRPLAPHELALAHHAGVREPQRIRVLELDHFPQPADPALCAAARARGLLSERTCGLTAGHGILLRRGVADARVLSHECRHVQQYEVAGSTLAFLTEYLGQIVEYGYRDAPLERDACEAHHHSHSIFLRRGCTQ